MYLNIRVPVPEVKGRIFFSNRKNGTIVNYEYGRVYVPEKRYNIPKRTTIGKICPDDPKMMNPNANYMKYLQDQLKGEAEKLGLESEQDVNDLMKSIRDED